MFTLFNLQGTLRRFWPERSQRAPVYAITGGFICQELFCKFFHKFLSRERPVIIANPTRFCQQKFL